MVVFSPWGDGSQTGIEKYIGSIPTQENTKFSSDALDGSQMNDSNVPHSAPPNSNEQVNNNSEDMDMQEEMTDDFDPWLLVQYPNARLGGKG